MKFSLKAGTSLATLLAATIPATAQEAGNADQPSVEEITVTGSYIRRKSQQDTASPIQVIDRDAMAAAGVTTISDFTGQLTINNGAQNNPDAFTQNYTAGTENINLRGLGVASTLVLLNGKRTVTSAAQTDGGLSFVDTASLIPAIAIDNVEILKDGAGALYGSDAVAGVVNFKTRSNFEGFEVQGEVKNITGTSQRDITFGAIGGWHNDRMRLMAAVNYLDRNNLSMRDRDLRTQEMKDAGVMISATSGYPGTFLVPSAPMGSLTQQLAFLSAYDKLAPTWDNMISTGAPAAQLPAELAALGIISNSAPGFAPFPSIAGQPGANFTGYAPANPANGEGVIFVPAAAAQMLGLGNQAISLGADGIADALTNSVYQSAVFPGVAQAISGMTGVPASMIGFNAIPAAEGAAMPYFADPYCDQVAAEFEDVIPMTTPYTNPLNGETVQLGTCGYDYNNQFDLVPSSKRTQGYMEFGYDLSDSMELYGSASFARTRSVRGNSNLPMTPISIAANNPFNEFRSPVLWLGRSAGHNFTKDRLNPNPSEHNSDTWRVETGLKGDVAGWSYDVSVVHAENDYFFNIGDARKSRLTAALNGYGGPDCDAATSLPGTNGCQYFNPFGNGLIADAGEKVAVLDENMRPVIGENGKPVMVPVRNSDEIIDWINQELTLDGKAKTTVVDAVFSGDLFEIPTGAVGAAFGVQYRKESLGWDFNQAANDFDYAVVLGASDFEGSRDSYAAFGEVLVPLSDTLELSGALRFEDYGGSIGSTLDPKVSLLYRPTADLSLRATYSSSFRAPSVFQQVGNLTNLSSVRDPRDGGAPYVPVLTLGTDGLKPETADTYTAGATWQPVDGLTLDVSLWRFEFQDVIIKQVADDVVSRALAGGETDLIGTQVFLDPSNGALSRVAILFENASFIKTDGVDFSARYIWDTDAGTFTVSGMGTYVNSYKLPLSGGTFDGAGKRNRLNFADPIPRLRGNVSLGYTRDEQMAQITLRYVSSFTDDENSTWGTLPGGTEDFNNLIEEVRVGSYTTVDLFYSYDLTELLGVNAAALSVGAVNIFDQRPPAVFTDGGFETRTHDPRGRIVYAGFKFGF